MMLNPAQTLGICYTKYSTSRWTQHIPRCAVPPELQGIESNVGVSRLNHGVTINADYRQVGGSGCEYNMCIVKLLGLLSFLIPVRLSQLLWWKIYNISPTLFIRSCRVTRGVDFDSFWWGLPSQNQSKSTLKVTMMLLIHKDGEIFKISH